MKEYATDFEDCFPTELAQFVELMKKVSEQEQREIKSETTELKMLSMLNQFKCIQTFPNVHIALRIYLSMMSSNCSGERSFSKLKRIKNEVRSCMAQKRLNMLSLMSIENEIVKSQDFSDIIHEFALRKARKRPM